MGSHPIAPQPDPELLPTLSPRHNGAYPRHYILHRGTFGGAVSARGVALDRRKLPAWSGSGKHRSVELRMP